MKLSYIILETALMMGFTFIIGIAFAYVLKLMIFIFSNVHKGSSPSLVNQIKEWCHAYREDLSRSYEHIRLIMHTDDGMMREMPLDEQTKDETVYGMNGMAEYHFGNLEEMPHQVAKVNYELRHGKI